jgi:voltage-gated potassium channel Kch
MSGLVAIVALALIVAALWDVFETVVLPRRVNHRYRLTRVVVRSTWRPVAWLGRRIHDPARREAVLAYYGPLAVLLLLVTWAVVFVVGYGALQWAFGSQVTAPEGTASFGTDLYMSATTFFTLGLGDVLPRSTAARLITVVEVANGFGLIALVIGYMPALYQAFSRREVNISLLDARAGSPPSAGELLRRHIRKASGETLEGYLREWERWAAELMETHLSYPLLAYFRSQHDNQSWVAAITAILDVCALSLAGLKGKTSHQAGLTFAIARHAVVDLGQVFLAEPRPPDVDRLGPAEWERLLAVLAEAGVTPTAPDRVEARLRELRALYEPYAHALADYLQLPLPPWLPAPAALDDWQTSATAHQSVADAGISTLLPPELPGRVEVAAEPE